VLNQVGQIRTVLVTGAFGQIGSELVPALRDRYGPESVIASDLRMAPAGMTAAGPHAHLDCTDSSQLLEIVRRHDVGAIYHLAALLSATAEAKPQVAWALNMGSLYNGVAGLAIERAELFSGAMEKILIAQRLNRAATHRQAGGRGSEAQSSE
jgi:dTDP-4-dehydrorhamnose reductase